MKSLRVTLLGLACALPALSFAQWQWVDNNGRKVYSDQSPPSDIPTRNILRQPGVKGSPAPAESLPATASQPASAAAPKVGGKDKELEERKKQVQAADASKKKAYEEQLAKYKADNCDRARRSKAALDSGTRIARFNAKGESEYLDDAARAAETKRVEGIIANDCNPASAQ